MLTSKVAKRYAQGLLNFTSEKNEVNLVYNEMKIFIKTFCSSSDLKNVLESPFIDAKKKITIIKEIFKNFSKSSLNFLELIIKQGRESHFLAIAQEFIEKINTSKGLKKVTLTTASPLSDELKKSILKNTAFNLGDNYELFTQIKPEILGGYILRMDDFQIDNSVKTKLDNLKKDFQLKK